MRVIICGAGRVGQGIARQLAREFHDITMVDEATELIERVQIDLDVQGVIGNAAYPETLKAAGADTAEMLIAVTHLDEINMVICQVADTLFKVPTKIARVRAKAYLERANSDLFSREGFPIDLLISPELEVADAILQRIKSPGALSSITFEKGELQILGMRVDNQSPLLNVELNRIADLYPELQARIVGIKRDTRVFAPNGDDKLEVNDAAYVAVSKRDRQKLYRLFNKSQDESRRIIIVGGGNIGVSVASQIEKQGGARVRLIEASSERAEKAVSSLKQTVVINGDGLSRDILDEAGIAGADILIAVTNDDKTNMLIGKLAKRLGAKRAHVLVNSSELVTLAGELNIDAVLDPRSLSVSRILTKLRRGRIVSVQSLEDGEAEIVEGITLDTSSLINQPISYDALPDGVNAAALVRDDTLFFPSPDLTVQPKDRLFIFHEASQTRLVEQYFRTSTNFF
ncbi:MAG: Trk system potassium transporter TrkA [Pseudomonadota bacterium]